MRPGGSETARMLRGSIQTQDAGEPAAPIAIESRLERPHPGPGKRELETVARQSAEDVPGVKD